MELIKDSQKDNQILITSKNEKLEKELKQFLNLLVYEYYKRKSIKVDENSIITWEFYYPPNIGKKQNKGDIVITSFLKLMISNIQPVESKDIIENKEIDLKQKKKLLKEREKQFMNNQFEKIKLEFDIIFKEEITKNNYMSEIIDKFQISNNLFVNIYFKDNIKKELLEHNKDDKSLLKNNTHNTNDYIVL